MSPTNLAATGKCCPAWRITSRHTALAIVNEHEPFFHGVFHFGSRSSTLAMRGPRDLAGALAAGLVGNEKVPPVAAGAAGGVVLGGSFGWVSGAAAGLGLAAARFVATGLRRRSFKAR